MVKCQNCTDTPLQQKTNKNLLLSLYLWRAKFSAAISGTSEEPKPRWNVGLVLFGAFLGLELPGVVFVETLHG